MPLALSALLGLGPACGSPRFDVPRYPHPESSPAEPVSIPPPPAQIEQVAERPPAPGCLWADGQWVWTVQRWDWHPGGWVRPPEGCRYSPPTVQWAPAPGSAQGILYYRPGRWYAVGEPKICPDAVSCTTPAPSPSVARPSQRVSLGGASPGAGVSLPS